jgi:hypothetical protein
VRNNKVNLCYPIRTRVLFYTDLHGVTITLQDGCEKNDYVCRRKYFFISFQINLQNGDVLCFL